MFTLIGGGIKKLEDATKSMAEVIPQNTKWIQDAASKFDPNNKIVYTKRGDKIAYEYLVVALGLQLNYNKVSLKSIYSFIYTIILISVIIL